jgi:DNA-binding transcriptional LysR family regulator
MSISRLASIDMNLLLVLDALLIERNATRAATRLGLTQPAVSRALSRLRAHFDDPLFVRVASGLAATPRAESIAPLLREALDRLGDVVTRAEIFDPATSARRFVISTADLAELVVTPGLMQALAEDAPGVDVTLRSPNRNVVAELESGALDLALGLFKDGPAAFRRQALFRDGFACLVRRDHPTVRGKSLSLADYVALSHVLIAPYGRPHGFVDDVLAEQGHARRIALVVPHFLVAPLIVARTDHVLTLPRCVAQHFAARERLRVLDPPVAIPEFTISQMWHERMQNDPAHTWLRATVLRAAQAGA